MEKYQEGIITALLCASLVALITPAIIYFVRRIASKLSRSEYRKSGVSRVILFSASLIVAVWCLRYAVGYFTIASSDTDVLTLTWWEEIFNSLLHALQTFSMDEDYTEYIISGKLMVREIFGEDTIWQTVYGIYASVLNFLAPVVGGAIIFEILASFFPKIRLRISYLAFWREKYFFSEPNDASLSLAKSILNLKAPHFQRPVIIFADAYADDEDEKMSEILLEAKMLGVICIKDDLAYVSKNKFGRRKFFLIDEAESGNLQTLAALANVSNREYLKKSEIYLFTNDDAYVQIERRIRDKLVSDLNFTSEELPVFVPIQSYRNLISSLLVDIPLYEPLIGKERNEDGTQDLNVTILGTGYIGTEMFLSTYWFGQILNCNLKINVLSQESEDEFWSKIDYVNPEIRHTTICGDPILKINRRGDIAKPYCEVNYLQCDVKSSEFIVCMTDTQRHILDTDYFLVSLGTDEDNISVANTVRKYIGQHHIHISSPLKTVIAYVVYDTELSKTLNRKKYYSFVGTSVDVYMQAIGSLHDVYSVRNVFLTEHESFAQRAHDAYMAVQDRERRAQIHKKRMDDDYKYWANLARGMHIKYKVFSMGMMEKSIFDYPYESDRHSKEVQKCLDNYKKVVLGQVEFTDSSQEKEYLALLHKMAWLEHRRWNAFTRVKGFRYTRDYDVYAVPGVIGSYKQMDIKLHPCLVECDQKGIRAAVSSKGIIDQATLFKQTDQADFDMLDDLSYDLFSKKYNDYDFKQYDYPMSEF